MRFCRRGVQICLGPGPVLVAVEDGDRFLSLVVTDGGDRNDYDGGAFAEPSPESRPQADADRATKM